MLASRRFAEVVFALFFGIVFLAVRPARAANFEVNPVRVALSSSSPNGLITVRNQSTEPLRFQVTAFSWKQGPGGDMVLAPTEDLIVFPTMFSLRPGESRNMRVGSSTPIGAVEKTYRIFVEELPPLVTSSASPNTIRVVTRMGIPVFLGSGGVATPRLEGLAVQGRHLEFSLRNAGTAFFFSRHVRVSFLGAGGSPLGSRELPAWYMLAGAVRAYALDLPDEACAASRLEVEVESETASFKAAIALPANACAR